MTISKAIAAVVSCAVLFGAIGGLLGGVIGTRLPSYYRSVFRGGNEPRFDPVAVGVGQGVTQGLAGGVLAGVFLTTVLVWRERRAPGTGVAIGQQTVAHRRPIKPWAWIFIASGIGLLLSAGGCSVGLFIGAVIGEQGAQNRQFQEERRLIVDALASDPLRDRIEIEPRSDGGVCVSGSVTTAADRDRLRETLALALGQTRAAELIIGVEVHEVPDSANGRE